MTVLDDPNVYSELDPTGLHDRIASLPGQCSDAFARGLSFAFPPDYAGIDRVLLLGMGGSAIGGDLLADIQESAGGVPVEVYRGYSPPRPVGESTLVIASSYSGETEETLAAFESVWRPGLRAIACTRGGTLLALFKDKGLPVFPIEFEGEPRSSLGYAVFGPLGFLGPVTAGSDLTTAARSAIEAMDVAARRLCMDVPTTANPAKQVALRAGDRAVVVYGAEHLSATARRWRNQFAENAKTWAFFEQLPEADHISVEGVRRPSWLASRVAILMLRSGLYNQRNTLRMKLTRGVLEQAGCTVDSFDAEGDDVLSQVMTSVLFGDFVSYYTAILNGVPPSETPNLEAIKTAMAARKGP